MKSPSSDDFDVVNDSQFDWGDQYQTFVFDKSSLFILWDLGAECQDCPFWSQVFWSFDDLCLLKFAIMNYEN